MNERAIRRSMGIIQVVPTLGMGGAERIVCELSRGLAAKGFSVKIVTTLAGGPLEAWCHEHDVTVEKLERRDPFGWSTTRDLIKIFCRERPFIVHTHLSGPDLWGRLAAQVSDVPVVLSTEHNTLPGTGRIKHVLKTMIGKRGDGVVAVSKEVRRLLIERDRYAKDRVFVIQNGIDMGSVVSRGTHPFHTIPRLISVGRLYPQKGHAILFRALAALSRPWQLWMMGDGPCAAELRQLAEDLGIASRIVWFGIRDDVPKLLADADLFCFPSQWEGQGLAAIEAAAAGIPVVASDVPGLHDTFQKQDVTFVPPASIESWAEVLENILNDPAPFIAKAARTALSIQSRMSKEQMIDAYATLYGKILKRKGLQKRVSV